MPRYCQKTAAFDKRRNVMWVWFEAEKKSELWQCAQGVWSKAKSGAVALPILGCVYNDARAWSCSFTTTPRGRTEPVARPRIPARGRRNTAHP